MVVAIAHSHRSSSPLGATTGGLNVLRLTLRLTRLSAIRHHTRLTGLGGLRACAQVLICAPLDPVLSDAGEPIIFTPDETDIEISGDGAISTTVGKKESRIGIYSFPDENLLEKVGGNLYSTSETPQKALEASIVQGMIEQSNVQAIIEVTNMIEALRAYQAAQKIIDAEMRLQDETIDTLTDTTTA